MATRRKGTSGEMTAGSSIGEGTQDATLAATTSMAVSLGDLPPRLRRPVPDQAYVLHCRGYSLRAIAARLGIGKDTANNYIREIQKEMAPARKADRERNLRTAVARFRAIAHEAADQFDETGEAALLNTMATCEREIARLHGLYATALTEDGEGDTGITITISRRDRSGEGA